MRPHARRGGAPCGTSAPLPRGGGGRGARRSCESVARGAAARRAGSRGNFACRARRRGGIRDTRTAARGVPPGCTDFSRELCRDGDIETHRARDVRLNESTACSARRRHLAQIHQDGRRGARPRPRTKRGHAHDDGGHRLRARGQARVKPHAPRPQQRRGDAHELRGGEGARADLGTALARPALCLARRG